MATSPLYSKQVWIVTAGSIALCGLFLIFFKKASDIGAIFARPRTIFWTRLNNTPAPLPEQLRRVDKIVFLGDSITNYGGARGGFVDLFQEYLRYLYPKKSFQIVNAGRGGHTSGQMLARFKRDVIQQTPQLVFILTGTNDLVFNWSLSEFSSHVAKMIDEAQSHGIAVCIISIPIFESPAVRPSHKDFNEALKRLATEKKVTFANVVPAMQAVRTAYTQTTGSESYFLTVDGIHLSGAGNLILCQELLKAVGVSAEVRNAVRSSYDGAPDNY